MIGRGSGAGNEYKRIDNTFYRGIVVQNNDPSKLNRVKVYIPELTNQPFDSWFGEFQNINIKSMGENTSTEWSEKETNGDWVDVKMYDEISKLIPWAEQCTPLFGESSNFRYYKDGKISTISDCNYPEGFEINNTDSPTLSAGSFSPAFLYENEGTRLGDAFSKPLDNFSVKCNPYAFSYAPSKHVHKAKGMFGVPEIGSKVWVFHYEGDSNYPVYFGGYRDYRELALINDTDNKKQIGQKYPLDF
jgi:hypothetical protein